MQADGERDRTGVEPGQRQEDADRGQRGEGVRYAPEVQEVVADRGEERQSAVGVHARRRDADPGEEMQRGVEDRDTEDRQTAPDAGGAGFTPDGALQQAAKERLLDEADREAGEEARQDEVQEAGAADPDQRPRAEQHQHRGHRQHREDTGEKADAHLAAKARARHAEAEVGPRQGKPAAEHPGRGDDQNEPQPGCDPVECPVGIERMHAEVHRIGEQCRRQQRADDGGREIRQSLHRGNVVQNAACRHRVPAADGGSPVVGASGRMLCSAPANDATQRNRGFSSGKDGSAFPVECEVPMAESAHTPTTIAAPGPVGRRGAAGDR